MDLIILHCDLLKVLLRRYTAVSLITCNSQYYVSRLRYSCILLVPTWTIQLRQTLVVATPWFNRGSVYMFTRMFVCL